MVRAPLHFHGRIPVPEVAPLTYRDGVTHLELVYELSQYLKNVLHPSLQSTVDQVVADAEQLLSDATAQYVDGVQEFQRIHDAFMSDVQASLRALNDTVVADLVTDDASYLSTTLRELFLEQEDTDGAVAGHLRDENSETRTVVDTLMNNLDIGDELRSEFNDLSTDIRSQVDSAVSDTEAIADQLLSDVDQTVRDRLGSQLADMVLNDPETRKTMSQMLSREDVVRTEFSQLGARILVGTLSNHGSDGKQGNVSGGPYEPYWQFHTNVSHQHWGFDRVETTDTNIILHTTSPGVNKRIIGGSIIANVDESMALENYFIGGSGGGGRTVLNIGRSKTISDRVHYQNGRWESRGVVKPRWDSDGQHLILEHETMYGQTGGHVTFWPRNDHFTMPAIVAQNTTRTIVNFWGPNGSKATSPHEGMGLHFSKSDSNATRINPKEIMVPGGNIWFTLIQMYVPENWSA